METITIDILTAGLQHNPHKPQSHRTVHPSPGTKTNSTIALVSPKKRILSTRSLDRHPAPELLFRAAKSDNAANALDTVPTPLRVTKQASNVIPGEHSPAEVIPPVRAADSSASGSAQRALATSSRHIVFPDSSMKLPDGSYRWPIDEEIAIIRVLFPRAYQFNSFGPVFVIVFRELPPKPWPLTIGGMPVYFTTDAKKYPFPHGFYGSNGRALQDHSIKPWTTPTDEQTNSIFEYFNTELHIRIESVIWLGMIFHITIPLGTTRKDAPAVVLGLPCTYSFPDAAPYKEAAPRNMQTMGTLRDDPDYSQILRPGATGTINELLTSSGVPVKKEGKHFATVFGEEAVWHSNASSSTIGEVKAVFGSPSISSMEPRPGYTYATETFGTTQAPAVVPQKFRHYHDVRFGDSVYLDSPLSDGSADGVVIGIERLDNHTPNAGQRSNEDGFVTIVYVYVRNGDEEPLEGTCGSAVWDDDGNVIGFLRIVDKNGMALVTSPASLMRDGWEIAVMNSFSRSRL